MTHEPCASLGDCYHARAGRIGGPISGRKNVENGMDFTALGRIGGHEVKVRAGRIGGLIGGRNGSHEDKVRAGRIGGRIGNREGKARGGRIQGRISGRKAVESGRLARMSKGVPSTADGILFRSQTEASFYCVAKELGGEPTYEPNIIELDDGKSYTPDFVLGTPVLGLPANTSIELKPARNAFYNGNLQKALRAGSIVVYWDELVEAA